MSSDFFLRPAHARFNRPPVLDDETLSTGESGAREADRGGADERTSGKNRGFEDEGSEDAERSEVMISDWLELDNDAAGRRSEEALEEENEEERELEERDVGTLLDRAWVSVVRDCDEGIMGNSPDQGREERKENDKDTRFEQELSAEGLPTPETGGQCQITGRTLTKNGTTT
ncbi:hypothetical protein ONZ51_g3262 [Trametes cubensis]|uniref:Uncharacterized protein n=1 Tax=Trametes cubensis TaxID=1111947 RepID=A0AAD7XFT8_9APHY|nr:hypothetical protein ONZ51_g3262 [Trametes cubensis]